MTDTKIKEKNAVSPSGAVAEVRLNDDQSLDEVCGPGGHLEQMDSDHWFLEIADVAVWLRSSKRITASFERREVGKFEQTKIERLEAEIARLNLCISEETQKREVAQTALKNTQRVNDRLLEGAARRRDKAEAERDELRTYVEGSARLLADALPIVQRYANENPRWHNMATGTTQDPQGAHEWLDAYAALAKNLAVKYEPSPKCPACGYVESHDANCPRPEARDELHEIDNVRPCQHEPQQITDRDDGMGYCPKCMTVVPMRRSEA